VSSAGQREILLQGKQVVNPGQPTVNVPELRDCQLDDVGL